MIIIMIMSSHSDLLTNTVIYCYCWSYC